MMEKMTPKTLYLIAVLLLLSGCAPADERVFSITPSGFDETESAAADPVREDIQETDDKSHGMGQEEAVRLMMEAGCPWDLSEPDVCIRFEDPDWIIRKHECMTTCRVDAFTGELDVFPKGMCGGIVFRRECSSDADCEGIIREDCTGSYDCGCATAYVCENDRCMPEFGD